jgi:transcriptional regulator with XRE-family HTH domain
MTKQQINSNIGYAIKFYREKKKFTQQQLSEKTKMSKRMLQYIEAGTRTVTVHKLYDLAFALEISPRQLIG